MKINVAVIFPNKKHGGIYSLGPMYVETYFNLDKRFEAKRYFLDDLPKGRHHIYIFSISYELDLPKVPKILKKLGIPLNKEKREELVIAGGPAVRINPYYLKDIIDFEILGEAEATIPYLYDPLYNYFKHKNKGKLFEEIKDINGIFIPEIKEKEEHPYIENLDESIHPIYQPLPKKLTRKYVFGNAFILEVARSCPFNCAFCDVKFLYKKFRFRSLEKLKEIINLGLKINGKKKIALISPTLVHPNLFDLLHYILEEKKTKFMLPSLRAELLLNDKMLEFIKRSGQRTITLAPETGSEELRFQLNKRIPDWVFFEIAKKAKNYGIKELKFYFIVGLPNQDMDDAYRIVEFIKKIKELFKGKIYVSVNPFVPKRGSLLENAPFDEKKSRKMIQILKKEFRKLKIRYKFKSIKTAKKEYLIQWERRRGDLNPGPAGINRPHPG